jgi:hypothetical protein
LCHASFCPVVILLKSGVPLIGDDSAAAGLQEQVPVVPWQPQPAFVDAAESGTLIVTPLPP